MDKLTKDELKALRKKERLEEEAKQKNKGLLKMIGVWVGIVLFLGLSVLILIKAGQNSSSNPNDTQTIQVPPVTKEDVTNNVKSPKATLIEYSDFQCPACAYYFTMVKKLTTEYKDRLLFAYRFFPLAETHPNSQLLAQAAYASYKQGKFWEMHDLFFEHQKELSESNASELITAYAKQLNLDVEKFQKDLDSDETKKFIDQQRQQAESIGIYRTPTFFLNGKQISAKNYEEFKGLIDEQIKQQ